MADHSQALGFTTAEAEPIAQPVDSHVQRLAFTFFGGDVTYVMFGHDQQCADGVTPTIWESPGAPDPTGALAPPFPCGGPWESIWVGAVKT